MINKLRIRSFSFLNLLFPGKYFETILVYGLSEHIGKCFDREIPNHLHFHNEALDEIWISWPVFLVQLYDIKVKNDIMNMMIYFMNHIYKSRIFKIHTHPGLLVILNELIFERDSEKFFLDKNKLLPRWAMCFVGRRSQISWLWLLRRVEYFFDEKVSRTIIVSLVNQFLPCHSTDIPRVVDV